MGTFLTKEQTNCLWHELSNNLHHLFGDLIRTTIRICRGVMIKHKGSMKSCTWYSIYLKPEGSLTASRLAAGPGPGARTRARRWTGSRAAAGFVLTGAGGLVQVFHGRAGRSGLRPPALRLVFGVLGRRMRGRAVASAAMFTRPVSEQKTLIYSLFPQRKLMHV